MWIEGKEENNTVKVRPKVASFCRGLGLDLGCGKEKIVPTAIGIDNESDVANIALDLAANNSLGIFSNGQFDYVFSSHLLDHFRTTDAVLKEWWRVIKHSGYLILYVQDPEYAPRVGTQGADVDRLKDLTLDDVWSILDSFGNAKLIHKSRHNESNEYSWLLVVQKTCSIVKKAFDLLIDRKTETPCVFPRKKKTNKECLVIRYGAFGDMVWLTPVLEQLKKEGYYVVVNCNDYSSQVLNDNPNVDEFIIQSKTAVDIEKLDDYWKVISEGFEKVINLSGSVEGKILIPEFHDDAKLSHNERHKRCNVNYQDATMEAAGYPKLKGLRPSLYFTDIEHRLAQTFRNNYKDKFLILWPLAGSSFHKIYPWSEYVAGEILKRHDDVKIINVGDYQCKLLEFDFPEVIRRSGEWTIRQSMIMTKYVDLVLGCDTGVMNAASCFETPKIVLLTGISEENLTKYWTNTQVVKAKDCPCYPCHKLIYTREACPHGKQAGGSLCSENIDPKDVYKAFEKVYYKWKRGTRGT